MATSEDPILQDAKCFQYAEYKLTVTFKFCSNQVLPVLHTSKRNPCAVSVRMSRMDRGNNMACLLRETNSIKDPTEASERTLACAITCTPVVSIGERTITCTPVVSALLRARQW